MERSYFWTPTPPLSTHYARLPSSARLHQFTDYSHGFTWKDGTDVGELLLLYDHVMDIGEQHHVMNMDFDNTFNGTRNLNGTFNGT